MDDINGKRAGSNDGDSRPGGDASNIRLMPICPECHSHNAIIVGNLEEPDKDLIVCIACGYFATKELVGHKHWVHVLRFAIATSRKMQQRQHNADPFEVAQGGPGWRTTHVFDLLARAYEELDELARELSLGSFEDAQSECADVNAFVAMIYDKCEVGKELLANEKPDS